MRSHFTTRIAGERSSQSHLQLFPASPDLCDFLAGTLLEHGIVFEWNLNLFSIRGSHSDAEVIGLLREVLSESQRQGIRVLTGAAVLPLDDWWQRFETTWFGRALADDQFVTWFQPIVEISECVERSPDATVAHECLIRLCGDRVYNGGEILEAAHARDEMRVFDSHARRLAIRSAALQSREGLYFLNFMPSSIDNPSLCLRSSIEAMEDAGMRPANFVFEIVESDLERTPVHLRKICDYFRDRGFGLAISDVGGTGSNSLGMVEEIRPDFIKLDKSLAQNLEHQIYMGTIIRQLVEAAGRLATIVIAQGVERRRTAEILLKLGVRHMQDYLFGHPAPNIAGPVRNQETTVTRSQLLPT